jgi:hypothetical protein
MSDKIYETVRRVVCEVTGAKPKDIRPETRFSELDIDEEDFYRIYRTCCAELNVSLNSILNTMPIYRVRAGALVMASLRRLAPFSKRAAMVLDEYDVHFEDETIESLAQTMYKGRYISSGKTQPPLHPPHSKAYMILWLFGLFALVFLIPYSLAYLPCSSIKAECASPIWTQMKAMLPVTAAIGAVCLGFAFGPGLWGMRQYEEKIKQRVDKWGDRIDNRSD